MKDTFTTGEVARLCHVSTATVSKWFDDGRIRGYRIPGSQHRRILREDLAKFMERYGIPKGGLNGDEG